MTTLYLAGPMRGHMHFNFPAFFEAEARLVKAGFDVINPARRDVDNGFQYHGKTGNEDLSAMGFNLKESLLWDLQNVAEADGVAVLPEWDLSKGATAEVSLARALGKEVRTTEEWAPVYIQYAPEPPAQAPRADVLEEAARLITQDRNNSYGPPTQDFRRTAGALTAMGYRRLDTDEETVLDLVPSDIAIMVGMVKTSRLMHQRNKRDNWVDAAGYAGCGYECSLEEA